MKSRTIALVAMILITISNGRAQESRSGVPVLTVGQPVEREIAGQESHSYKIQMGAAHFAHVVVFQRDIDLVVTLFAPGGTKISEVDSPNGTFGPETVVAIAEQAGEFRLEVRPLTADAAKGKYEIRIQELRVATQDDKSRIATHTAAQHGQLEAIPLHSKGDAESLKSALKKYESAMALWRRLEDKYWEAYLLNNIGDVYVQLDDKQKALEVCNQALSINRAAGDLSGEALSLASLGAVYHALREDQRALGYYNRAILINRTIGDHGAEGTALTSAANIYNTMWWGDSKKALKYNLQALPLLRAAGNRNVEANTLIDIGVEYERSDEHRKARDYYNQALSLRRATGNREAEAVTLDSLGGVSEKLDEKQKALEYYTQALSLSRNLGDRKLEASLLSSIARVHGGLSDLKKALEYYNQSLSITHTLDDREREAAVLQDISKIYEALGDKQKAVGYADRASLLTRPTEATNPDETKSGKPPATEPTREQKRRVSAKLTLVQAAQLRDEGSAESLRKAIGEYEYALAIFRELADRGEQASVLIPIGLIYADLGEMQKARENYDQALSLARAVGRTELEATLLHNLAGVYFRLGDWQKALDYFSLSLPITRAIGNREGEGRTLSNLGLVYDTLGQTQMALDHYNQALRIKRAIGDHSGEADTLSSIGSVYVALGELKKALTHFDEALLISRALEETALEASVLSNIGATYSAQGDKKKALDHYNEALLLRRRVGDRAGESTTLTNIGAVYEYLGEGRRALAFYNQALPLVREVRDPGQEARILTTLMYAWSESNPALAIFYGKQAINLLQRLRANISGLDTALQKSFLHSKEDAYRELASVLVSMGRLSEAQQVLGLLKEEEYFEFVRRDAEAASLTSVVVALSPSEVELAKRFAEVSDRVVDLGTQLSELRALEKRTPEQDKQFTALEAQLEVANQAFQKFLDQTEIELRKTRPGSNDVMKLREAQALQQTLAQLDAVALFTIVTEKKYQVFLMTATVQKAYESKISEAELNQKISAFSDNLKNPNRNPLPLAKELHRILIGPELARDLAQTKKQTVLWSLDGALRYVPMAALHDGQRYLVESYRNVVITLASRDHLNDAVSPKWQALGLGVSKPEVITREGGDKIFFGKLPGVLEELSGIVRDQTAAGQNGILPGKLMLDADFTAESMREALRPQGNAQPFKLVHIASHFNFEPGNETRSFLLLGGGKTLTLAQLKSMFQIFSGVELLTLSACNTATGGEREGKEVEGFAVLAQRQGAQAIVASLWPVADISTSQLMRNFYRLRDENPAMTKAEAMRQAQLAFLRPGPEVDARFAHPYYWAPFILVGNWR